MKSLQFTVFLVATQNTHPHMVRVHDLIYNRTTCLSYRLRSVVIAHQAWTMVHDVGPSRGSYQRRRERYVEESNHFQWQPSQPGIAGIGKTLAQAYLSRPSHTVVGTIRDDSAPGVVELKASAKGPGSKLLLVDVESASPTDAKRAVEEATASGIDHIDIVIANAGVSPPVVPLETVELADVTGTFNINALGPLALYQACHELLEKSGNAKFVTISSAAGSIGSMENNGAYVAPAYSISKAALNWITL